MQQRIAGAIDAHIQALQAATTVATVALLTREDVELWLSGWCMIGREVKKPQIQRGEFRLLANGTRAQKRCQAWFRFTDSEELKKMKRSRTGLLLAMLTCTVAVSGQQVANGGISPADIVYAKPGKLVSVNGFRLNLYCVGSGSPTVVTSCPDRSTSNDDRAPVSARNREIVRVIAFRSSSSNDQLLAAGCI